MAVKAGKGCSGSPNCVEAQRLDVVFQIGRAPARVAERANTPSWLGAMVSGPAAEQQIFAAPIRALPSRLSAQFVQRARACTLNASAIAGDPAGCRRRPGSSCTVAMPSAAAARAGRCRSSCRICGEPIAPAASITSRVRREARCIALPEGDAGRRACLRSAQAPVDQRIGDDSRLGRAQRRAQKALAAFQRTPRLLVDLEIAASPHYRRG